jgi:hypothetical protein
MPMLQTQMMLQTMQRRQLSMPGLLALLHLRVLVPTRSLPA